MSVWLLLLREVWARLRRLLNRSPAPDSALRRLNRLRAIYRANPNAGLHTRRVRDTLRAHVAPEYQTHYDRLLRFERAAADLLHNDVRLAVPNLLLHVYSLTERVVRLIEQLQRGDQLVDLYPDGSAERAMVADARRRLITQIDEAIALQESIPARLMQLSAASTGRDLNQLREALTGLDTRLEGMVDSYERLSLETAWQQRYNTGQIDHFADDKERQ
jgi:hypothetical protein